MMATMVLAIPVDNTSRKSVQQPKDTSKEQKTQQENPVQTDSSDQDDDAALLNKMMECRNMLQSYGFGGLNIGRGKNLENTTEGYDSEDDKKTDDKMGDGMNSGESKKTVKKN